MKFKKDVTDVASIVFILCMISGFVFLGYGVILVYSIDGCVVSFCSFIALPFVMFSFMSILLGGLGSIGLGETKLGKKQIPIIVLSRHNLDKGVNQ